MRQTKDHVPAPDEPDREDRDRLYLSMGNYAAKIEAGALMRGGIFPTFRQIALPDEFLDAGVLPTLHDRYGLSTAAVATQAKTWLVG